MSVWPLYLTIAVVLAPLPSFSQSKAGLEPGRLLRERVLPILRQNCLTCHGSKKTAGLDLRAGATALKGGVHGAAIVPGMPERSRLFRYVSGGDKIQMPPGRRLEASEVSAIRLWIEAGAPWPSSISATDAPPWPFNRLARPPIPAVKGRAWVRNPIDAFVLPKLEAMGLRPNPAAGRMTLIRRVSLDLIGLPPSPEEVDAFVKDRRPGAYERLVDRLLASPHYGERWARHWLDLARYAESEGFKTDEMRPNAWRYRDYVIKSLNEDKPYDRFIREQIAGDELYPDDPDALVATGFCRHWADESNARNLRLRRQEILNDITDTVGSTILGLTIGCARCHDHKYDPIPQADYYRLQAFFAAVRPRDDIPLLPSAPRAIYERRLREWEEKTHDSRVALAVLEEPYRKRIYHGKYSKFPDEVKAAIDTAPEKRTSLQWILFHKVEPQIAVTTAEVDTAIKSGDKQRWTALNREIDQFKPLHPGSMPLGLGITDVGPEAPKTYSLAVGVYNKPLQEVEPAVPAICGSGVQSFRRSGLQAIRPSDGPAVARDPSSVIPANSTGRRSALAAWITSRENPLTARVMANRLWHYHFGRGVIGTPSDFGATGERATNPELLDWLAAEFVEGERGRGGEGEKRQGLSSNARTPEGLNAWSIKHIHRLIVTSNTYKQSAEYNPEAARVDPDNRLMWRFRRQRLEGEVIRDSILAVSGELNGKMGGPSIMPDLPRGLTTRGYWKETADQAERNRRSIYVFVKRNLRYPLFELFDMPDTHEPCARREVTTTGPQALALLNNDLILKSAQAFAGRVLRESSSERAEQVTRAYRLAFGRAPAPDELESGLRFLSSQTKLLKQTVDAEETLALPSYVPTGMDDNAAAALVDFCHALFNANEFVYVE